MKLLPAIGRTRAFALLACCLLFLAVNTPDSLSAQGMPAARALINGKIRESDLITLSGNTRPEANAANDRGAVAADFPMDNMLLQLRRSPRREQALDKYLDELEDLKSPNYHHWLTAQQIGERYGVGRQDLATITAWLKARGFTINQVYSNNMVIEFSGTAEEVYQAFHTAIHHLDVHGKMHVANMSDPKIPAALAPAVAGVVSLNDFQPQPQYQRNPNYTFDCSGGVCDYAVAPADLATIYNLNPLFSAGISGQNQTITVIELTDVSSPNDWNTFRSTYGLTGYTGGSFQQIHPGGCRDPGVLSGAETEAILDAEWASASAPNATITAASCASTSTSGELLAMETIVNGSGPYPQIISNSYGLAEALEGTRNVAISSLYQTAAGEGISVFVAAGDSAAAFADQASVRSGAELVASRGIAVNASASTPYDVAVGGTDFGDDYAGTTSTYWNATNGSGYGSAKSYIPEIPWNDTCASKLVVDIIDGPTAATYGSSSLCNNLQSAYSYLLGISGGGGGPSGCATGSPSVSGVVGGTCAGYVKPSWQSIVGNPHDGVRDLPDLSLFASNGPWGHSYVVCDSDSSVGGCVTGFGGTSFGAPIMAGIQALINQHAGSRQGNPNPTYYSLAATEYGPSGSAECNSTNGNTVSSSCIFYDVTQGDNDVPCTGTNNCYTPSGTYGVLSTSNAEFQPAYPTTTGWDFATGIGSVNAYNLVMAFSGGAPSPTPTGSPTATPTPAPTPTPTPTPVPVALKAAPRKVTFPKVAIGATSNPKKITLSNPAKKGGPSITLSSFGFSSNFGYFPSGTTCITSIVTLAPKQKCTISAGFKPSVAGKVTGTLTIQDNASNRPQTIELSGAGK